MQEAVTLVSFLEDVGTGIPVVLGWTVEAANTIIESPFMLATIVFLFLGGAIGILSRLLRRG